MCGIFKLAPTFIGSVYICLRNRFSAGLFTNDRVKKFYGRFLHDAAQSFYFFKTHCQ